MSRKTFQPGRSPAEAACGCRLVSDGLSRYVLGEWTTRDDRRLFNAHLRQCPACRRLADEAVLAWRSLIDVKPAVCPDRLVRRVLARAAPVSAARPAFFRRLTLVAGAAAAAAAAVLAIRLLPGPAPAPPADLAAILVASSPVPPPDVDRTFDDYLLKAEAFFIRLRESGDWRSLLPGLAEADLTGRGNYLKERLPAGSRELALVDRLHGVFLELLAAGRADGEAPPSVVSPELIEEIGQLRSLRVR